ncbi:MAG: hypothetical protein GX074_01540 [Erysipelothrix sp.]|nr:hypothetical protein [Erysipelothrix sp.]
MNNLTRRYLIPLGILVLGSFLINFLAATLPNLINANIYYLLVMLMLFSFGIALNFKGGKLKNYSLRHIIIVIFVILLYLFDTQIINVPLYKWFLSFVVGDAIIIKIFYIYFGWLFSER